MICATRPEGRGTLCAKANPRIYDCGLTTYDLCETNPICPRMGKNSRGLAGATDATGVGSIVRNKANFPRRAGPARGQACETKPIPPERYGGQVLCRKAIMRIGPAKGLGKTKPIPSRPAQGQSCETKPISARTAMARTDMAAGAVRINCAKRSQFRHRRAGPSLDSIVRNEPNSSRAIRRPSALWERNYDESALQKASEKRSQFAPGRRRVKRAKRSQFRRQAGPSLDSIVQNKAN